MSNHLTNSGTSCAYSVGRLHQAAGEARNTAYDATVANLKGMIFTKDAAATVKLLDLGC